MFEPQVGGEIAVGTKTYYFAEHPAFPSVGFVHGQEGRAGTVYRLTDTTGTDWALKVFDEAYQLEPPSSLLKKMSQLSALPGLSVCRRTILTPPHHRKLLQQSPELQYAVLMPWIKGTTWASTVDSKKPLKHEQSLALGNALLDILTRLEQSGIAHSDISSSNVIITSGNKPSLELVDVEQLYAPGLETPKILLASSPGYAHAKSASGLWQPEADRFAGAVLLAEILGWCDKRICAAAGGEIAQSYFRPGEEQTDCERYRLLYDVLQERWGQPVADLFQKTWRAKELSQCPTFAEWKSAITCAEWEFPATNDPNEVILPEQKRGRGTTIVFEPQVGGGIAIGTKDYRFAEHPAFPGAGFVHGQSGRAGTVYRLTDTIGTDWALKVFDEAYQHEPPSSLLEKMVQLVALPGLSVCRRTILTPAEHSKLLQQSPGLQYAVLMPWIKGTTWASTVDSRKPLNQKRSLALATNLVDMLVKFEQSGIAHSDLSNSNIIITPGSKPSIELVDVEQLYAPDLEAPHTLLGSSPGYAHAKSASGLWQPEADRFAGAVLLAEILGWCDKRICAAADGEIAQSYFRPGEEQTDCERYRLLHEVLNEQWGQPVADLFQKTWQAKELSQCPTFAEWKSAITFVSKLGIRRRDNQTKKTKTNRPVTINWPAFTVIAIIANAIFWALISNGYINPYAAPTRSLYSGPGLNTALTSWATRPPFATPAINTLSIAATVKAEHPVILPSIDAQSMAATAIAKHPAPNFIATEFVERYGPATFDAQSILATAEAEYQLVLPTLEAQSIDTTLTAEGAGRLESTPPSDPNQQDIEAVTSTPTPNPISIGDVDSRDSTQTLELAPGATRAITLPDGMHQVFQVHVPSGPFIMGSIEDDAEAYEDEFPQHEVFIDSFWIDRTEVTNSQYAACVADGVCPTPTYMGSWTRNNYYENPILEDFPVLHSEWEGANDYCRWTGGRLPTEAEWEKAARGTDGRTYPWGNEPPDCHLGNLYFDEYDCYVDTVRVGGFLDGASPYGALDMSGNAGEWVSDWYNDNYYALSPLSNPQGPNQQSIITRSDGTFLSQGHVIRGGGNRVALRSHGSWPPSSISLRIGTGFRCAYDP